MPADIFHRDLSYALVASKIYIKVTYGVTENYSTVETKYALTWVSPAHPLTASSQIRLYYRLFGRQQSTDPYDDSSQKYKLTATIWWSLVSQRGKVAVSAKGGHCCQKLIQYFAIVILAYGIVCTLVSG